MLHHAFCRTTRHSVEFLRCIRFQVAANTDSIREAMERSNPWTNKQTWYFKCNFRKGLYPFCRGPELRGEEKRGGSKSVDEADYHRYYDGRVAVICSDLLVVLGWIYDEVRGWKVPMVVLPKYYNNAAKEFWPITLVQMGIQIRKHP